MPEIGKLGFSHVERKDICKSTTKYKATIDEI